MGSNAGLKLFRLSDLFSPDLWGSGIELAPVSGETAALFGRSLMCAEALVPLEELGLLPGEEFSLAVVGIWD